MSITFARITKVSQPYPPVPDDTINLNCLNFFDHNILRRDGMEIPLYELVPYCLKDKDGHLMENIWQGSKVYESVIAQHEVKSGKVIWSHPSEYHIINGALTPAFWAWRKKLWNNHYAVRYPNGFHGRKTCLYTLWHDGIQWKQYQYIEARKAVYCKVYADLVQETTAYKQLKTLYDAGHNLQICEIDVRSGPCTEHVLRTEINNPDFAFGHGYVLAACLMGLTHIFDE